MVEQAKLRNSKHFPADTLSHLIFLAPPSAEWFNQVLNPCSLFLYTYICKYNLHFMYLTIPGKLRVCTSAGVTVTTVVQKEYPKACICFPFNKNVSLCRRENPNTKIHHANYYWVPKHERQIQAMLCALQYYKYNHGISVKDLRLKVNFFQKKEILGEQKI